MINFGTGIKVDQSVEFELDRFYLSMIYVHGLRLGHNAFVWYWLSSGPSMPMEFTLATVIQLRQVESHVSFLVNTCQHYLSLLQFF